MDIHGQHWPLVIRAAISALALWAAPAQACRLALVLAMDVSSSVNPEEDRLQRTGLAAALLDRDVQAAFFASGNPVALHAFEWSGRYDQTLLLPGWTLIETPDDLARAAAAIAGSVRTRSDMPTAMGHALGFASILLQERPDCFFHTIDVAGDGENNEGFSPALAYGAFPFDDVTVNALVVSTTEEPPARLVAWFDQNVLRGPGAFLEVARGFGEYEAAMKRKLLRELAVQVLGGRITEQGQAG